MNSNLIVMVFIVGALILSTIIYLGINYLIHGKLAKLDSSLLSYIEILTIIIVVIAIVIIANFK